MYGVYWLAALRFSDTITLGSIIVGLLLGVTGLAVFAYGARWKAAYETERVTAKSLEEGRLAFQQRSERVEADLREALEQALDLRARIKQLEQATDLTGAVEQMHAEHHEILLKIENLTQVLRVIESRFPMQERRAGDDAPGHPRRREMDGDDH